MTLSFIGLTLGLLFTTVFSVYIGFWPKVVYIHGFLAKIRIYMQGFGQNLHIHASFWPKVVYISSCSLNSSVHPPFWWVWCCGKLLGGLWVWLGLPWFWCLLDASYVTRDFLCIEFYLKVVLVIYPFCFAISALLFFVSVSCWACILYLLQRLRVLDDFYCIFHSFILKNTR